MYKYDTIVELVRRSDDYTLPLNSWSREHRGKTLCPNCFKLRDGVYPLVVDVFLLQLPDRLSHGGVFHGGVGVISDKLLDVLRPHLQNYVLGRCFDERGLLIPNYRSIYHRDRVSLRADPNAPNYSLYKCQTCGVVAEMSDSPYVLRADLSEAEVFESRIARLFLSEALAARFPWKQFRDLRPFVIPVLDTPPSREAPAGDRSDHSKHVASITEYLSSRGRPQREAISAINVTELVTRLNPTEAVLLCEGASCEWGKSEYAVPVRTILESGAGTEELKTLRELLGNMPGASSWEQLYAKHNGIGLFSPFDQVDPAIILLPIGCWLEEKEEMFEWFFEGVDEAFEGLPYGPDDVIPIAALSYSPDRWFLVTSGPNTGMIHFWGHDDSPMEETPFAESLEAFVARLTDEDAPEHFGGVVRFKAAHASEPRPASGAELYPVRYVVKRP